ncbi:hypothetical protein DITRI_Ditri18aG0074600 [Diplodiscus trichospermus]
MGWLKFNVDGAMQGQPGLEGIGGVLRNHESRVLMVFSKSIGLVNSNMVEILAVKEALSLFLSLQWSQSSSLIIESDSLNVVKWLRDPASAPWKLRNIVSQVENLKKKRLVGWSVQHTYRERNYLADGLAKTGVQRTRDLVVSYD